MPRVPPATQVEPSSSQDNQAKKANDAPTQEQAQDPPIVDQVALQEPSSPIVVASQDQDQDQDQSSSSHDEAIPNDDQGQHSGQDGDPNDQDDQVIPPRSNEDIEARRKARVAKALKNIDTSLDKVAENLSRKRTTRSQLASFSEHHAHISMVESI